CGPGTRNALHRTRARRSPGARVRSCGHHRTSPRTGSSRHWPSRLPPMPPLTVMDEHLVHQLPEPLPNVVTHHPHWRESYFFIAHQRENLGDVVILAMATFPQREVMDSLQMGRVGGESVMGYQARPFGGDPHTPDVGAARVD